MVTRAVLEPRKKDLSPKGAAVTVSRLRGLLSDEYDDEFAPPGEWSMSTAVELIDGAKALTNEPFPAGSPSADGAGRLRIEWRQCDREVRLVIAPKPGGRSYVYHEDSSGYATDRDIDAQTLATWLDWLACE